VLGVLKRAGDGQAAQQRWSAKDCQQYRQAAGAVAQGLMRGGALWLPNSETQPDVDIPAATSGAQRNIKKIHGIYCVSRAEERGCIVFLSNGPCFFSLRNGQTGPISLLSLSDHFGEIFPARVSSDNPRLKAFCRVAPSVLFNLRAISAARLLLRASLFNVRICSAVHARLFICPPDYKDCRRP
jgi:hypothetical protein